MGKCLSCSQEEDSTSMQNGQPVGSVQRAAAAQSHLGSTSLAKYHPQPQTLPPLTPEPTDPSPPPSIPGNRPLSTNGDKKLFSQYPKLPPIRKPSNGSEGKRTSFTLGRDYSEAKITALFEAYKDPEEDAILAEGIERLCVDLEVRPEEFRVLVLAWRFQADTMCRFTRPEFISGCKCLHADSIKAIQAQFPELLDDVKDQQRFKDLYRWTYKFGLDADTGQRTLPVDMAVSLWRLVFSDKPPQLLDQWLAFLEDHQNVRGIPKDTWDMFLNFVEAVGDDLSLYDDTEAWPSLFDDFVEYENDRQNQNVKTEKLEREYYN